MTGELLPPVYPVQTPDLGPGCYAVFGIRTIILKA